MIVQQVPLFHPMENKHVMTNVCDGMTLDAIMIRLKLVDEMLVKFNQDRETLESMKDALLRFNEIDWSDVPDDLLSQCDGAANI